MRLVPTHARRVPRTTKTLFSIKLSVVDPIKNIPRTSMRSTGSGLELGFVVTSIAAIPRHVIVRVFV